MSGYSSTLLLFKNQFDSLLLKKLNICFLHPNAATGNLANRSTGTIPGQVPVLVIYEDLLL